MSEEKKYVLFTPVGGNDPIGDKYDKDYMIKEIYKKFIFENYPIGDEYDKNYIIKEIYKKFIDVNDPIDNEYDVGYMIEKIYNKFVEMKIIDENKVNDFIKKIDENSIIEGPILHIVRHYKPKCVLLLFTNKKENIDYKYEILKKRIEILSEDCEVMPAIKELDAEYVYDWDEPIYNFNEKIESLIHKYKNHQVLINITSTTPAITFKLCHEVINNINFNLKAVQVLISLNKLHTYVAKDEKYIKDNINYIDDFYENNISRNTEPKIYSIVKPKIQSQIRSLISVGNDSDNGLYNYQALYNLLNKNLNISDELFGHSFLKLIKSANDKINLRYIDNHKFNIFKEYYFAMKVKQIKGELSDFILRITPFITELIYYFLYKNIPEIKNCFYTKNNTDIYINFDNINDTALKDKLRKAVAFNDVLSYLKIKKDCLPKSLYDTAVGYNNGLKKFIELKSQSKKLNQILNDKFVILKSKINQLSSIKEFSFMIKLNNNLTKYDYYKKFNFDYYGNIFDKLKNMYDKNYAAKELYDLLKDYKNTKIVFRKFIELLYKYKNKNFKELYITIKYLCIFAEHYQYKYDKNIFILFKEFEDIEDNIRHNVAHKLINITENDIKEVYPDLSSKGILDKCEMLLSLIFGKNNSNFFYNGKIDFEYDKINEQILKLL